MKLLPKCKLEKIIRKTDEKHSKLNFSLSFFFLQLFSVRALIDRFGQKIQALEKTYNYLGKDNVDELIGK